MVRVFPSYSRESQNVGLYIPINQSVSYSYHLAPAYFFIPAPACTYPSLPSPWMKSHGIIDCDVYKEKPIKVTGRRMKESCTVRCTFKKIELF